MFAAKHLILGPLKFRHDRRCREFFAALDVMQAHSGNLPLLNLREFFGENCFAEIRIFEDLASLLINRHCGEIAVVSHSELFFLCALAKHFAPGKVFEIGTGFGGTSYNLSLNLPADAKIISLSRKIWPSGSVELGQFLKSGRIELISSNSLDYDFSPYSGAIDLVFVDGGHDYETVKIDSINALRMIKPGGIIVWHDYSRWFPGVRRCLNKLGEELALRQVLGTSLVVYQSPDAQEPSGGEL